MGEVGDFVGLEVNMRPAGGYTTEMMNFAHATDVYQIWADMVTDDARKLPDSSEHHFCVFSSRRDEHKYLHTHEEILEKFGEDIVMCERMPGVLSLAMGQQMYTAKAKDKQAVDDFVKFVQERA